MELILNRIANYRWIARILDWMGDIGIRIYAFAKADTRLLASLMFSVTFVFFIVIALPFHTIASESITTLAPEWFWALMSGIICGIYLYGWIFKCRASQCTASLLSVFLWSFIGCLAFIHGQLWLLAGWSFVFCISSALLYFRAYLD